MDTKLIVFDFDGTLADTTATILLTYRMAIEHLKAPARSDDECRATIGLPLREGFRQLYPDFTEKQLDLCVDTYRSFFYENKQKLIPQLYPGVKETLDRIKDLGIVMSIASSRSRDSLIEFCDITGILGYFTLILGADDVVNAKPDPEPVLTTLDRLSHSPASTIVVGDMPVDILMGRGAGCRTVGVTYGNSTATDLRAASADHIIDRFPTLLSIINR